MTAIEPHHFRRLAAKISKRHRDDYEKDMRDRLLGLCELLASELATLTSEGVDHGIVYVVLNQTRWNGEITTPPGVFTDFLSSIFFPATFFSDSSIPFICP